MPRRAIDTSIWTDERFAELNPEAKLVYIRLVTGDDTGPAGASRVHPRRVAADTGLEEGEVAAATEELVASQLVRRYEGGWLWMPAWIRYQVVGPNFCRAVRRQARECPQALAKAIGRALDEHAPRTSTAREVSVAEAAVELRTSEAAVRRALREGRLPGTRRLVGGVTRWTVSLSTEATVTATVTNGVTDVTDDATDPVTIATGAVATSRANVDDPGMVPEPSPNHSGGGPGPGPMLPSGANGSVADGYAVAGAVGAGSAVRGGTGNDPPPLMMTRPKLQELAATSDVMASVVRQRELDRHHRDPP